MRRKLKFDFSIRALVGSKCVVKCFNRIMQISIKNIESNNAVKSKPMLVPQIGFLFQVCNLKESVLIENKLEVKIRVNNQNHRFLKHFSKCVLEINVSTFRFLKHEPVRGDE